MGTTSQSTRVLILGTGVLARELLEVMTRRSECGLVPVGLLEESGQTEAIGKGCPVLGRIETIRSAILEARPDRIVVALATKNGLGDCHGLLEETLFRGIEVQDGEQLYERLTGQLSLETLSSHSLLFPEAFRKSSLHDGVARSLSLVLASIGLLVLAPLMLILPLLIRLDSPGPALFRQVRMGAGCQPFTLLKYRTMREEVEVKSVWAADNAERITRVGKWLRKYRLDELPQFINVLRGDMNIVGPRPHPASNYEMYVLVSRNTALCGEAIPYYSLRSMVRPGITGWAQVKYHYANNLEEEMEKLRFDLYYVKYRSFWLDMRILLETVQVVLKGSGQEAGRDSEIGVLSTGKANRYRQVK